MSMIAIVCVVSFVVGWACSNVRANYKLRKSVLNISLTPELYGEIDKAGSKGITFRVNAEDGSLMKAE